MSRCSTRSVEDWTLDHARAVVSSARRASGVGVAGSLLVADGVAAAELRSGAMRTGDGSSAAFGLDAKSRGEMIGGPRLAEAPPLSRRSRVSCFMARPPG